MLHGRRKYSLKGFTLAEVLVTLALTSLAITFSYGLLSYTQKLFYAYRVQNRFITQYTDLKTRLDHESLKADLVKEESLNRFSILRDTTTATLQLLENVILLERNGHCDTFFMQARAIKKEYELMKNPLWTNRLVKSLSFETEFTKQKFNFRFNKSHDASLKLQLELQQ